ncbi:MAG TPA: hypothetical protein VEV62_06725 [Parafilimonas sp.]|nr:hypothetical protein [Parafilimonas sp.]
MGSAIREKLHQFIDSIEDKKAEAMYALFENEIENDSEVKRLNLVNEERAKYLKGEGKSFSWEEVKQMALNKSERQKL